MAGDRTGRGQPDRVAMLGDVLQRALEMTQAVRLADELGVQGHAHHQRPRGRELAHLVELIDDHIGEI
jgi:hypothetical protein